MDRPPKKTLVLGASDNPARYSFLALHKLAEEGHPALAIGGKKATVAGTEISTEPLPAQDVDTVTLYLSPGHQKGYYDYIFSLHPKRIIFNPGAENSELAALARSKGILSMDACTLVLLSTGQY